MKYVCQVMDMGLLRSTIIFLCGILQFLSLSVEHNNQDSQLLLSAYYVPGTVLEALVVSSCRTLLENSVSKVIIISILHTWYHKFNGMFSLCLVSFRQGTEL